MKESPENSKTIHVTASNGVTNRLWLSDFGATKGVIGVAAEAVEIANAEDPLDPASKSARIDVNVLSGDVSDTASRLIRPGASQSRTQKVRCIAYKGVDGDVDLEITILW
ncbi:hypothetical protein [Sulfuricurvum sp.]|uniref:hypothetical protein n=1 Tax=Sulfuricurvum sp. TaxID=2025608 RepID=UPI003567944D